MTKNQYMRREHNRSMAIEKIVRTGGRSKKMRKKEGECWCNNANLETVILKIHVAASQTCVYPLYNFELIKIVVHYHHN